MILIVRVNGFIFLNSINHLIFVKENSFIYFEVLTCYLDEFILRFKGFLHLFIIIVLDIG
jgi:hypothetical protein